MIALLGAGLVLALVVLAASPDLHERLHGHGGHAVPSQGSAKPFQADGDDDGCAVTLFAAGVTLCLAFGGLGAVAILGRSIALRFQDQWLPAKDRYRHAPQQGPPLVA